MKKVAPPPPPVPPPVEKAPPPPLSNGSVRRSVSVDRQRPLRPVSSTPGEDCAIDELLEGKMDLEVVLPDCKVVRMTIDRRLVKNSVLLYLTTADFQLAVETQTDHEVKKQKILNNSVFIFRREYDYEYLTDILAGLIKKRGEG